MPIQQLVPLEDLHLRAGLDDKGRIVGFFDRFGQPVSLSNTAPYNSVAPFITGTATVGETLAVSNGTWAGESLTYTYQWYADGEALEGETASEHEIVEADIDTVLSVTVTATNDVGETVMPSSNTKVAKDVAPVNSVAPAITGDGTVGVILSVNTGTWTGYTNDYTYQWKLDGAPILGATHASYTPLEAQIDSDITCTVTATNSGGTASETSAAVTVKAAP